jgi:predicted metal-dependent phosphoesterase TrpH
MKTIKVNFHVHTFFSYDGYNSFAAIYKGAKLLGLQSIAITDHDRIDGAIEFQKWVKEKNITDLHIILGEEVTCEDGTHIIGFFIKSHIPTASPLEVIKAIKDQQGKVFFPHPTRKDGICNSADAEAALTQGDFLEIFNAKIDHSFNLQAINVLEKYPNLTPLGGSDAHYNIDILKCYCEVPFQESMRQSVELLLSEKRIRIFGKEKYGSQHYFPFYYKYKQALNPPQFLRNAAKVVFPMWKNFKERNAKVQLTEVYSSF